MADKPGRYLLTTRHEGQLDDDPELDRRSYSVSVMLEVGPKGGSPAP